MMMQFILYYPGGRLYVREIVINERNEDRLAGETAEGDIRFLITPKNNSGILKENAAHPDFVQFEATHADGTSEAYLGYLIDLPDTILIVQH